MEKLAEISCIIPTYRWHHHDDNQAKAQTVQNNFVCWRYDDNSNSFYRHDNYYSQRNKSI